MANRLFVLIISIPLFLSSCMTYHEKYATFHRNLQEGNIESANEILEKDKKGEKRKTRLLYLFDRGVVAHMLGKYEESNTYFEKAYIDIEDYTKNYLNKAASFMTNPNMVKYKGEAYEHLMLHYYKALNYLYLNNYEAAIVEVKRMNIKLNALNDRYKDLKIDKYQKDAFIENLMGIIYDADKDYNNAFIAYRNAYDIYKTSYKKLFKVDVPLQLKKDLLRTAYLTGFNNKVEFYEKEFEMKNDPNTYPKQDLVFFWQNGLVPVKDEWSINFAVMKGQGGMVHFENKELGLSFPFMLSSNQQSTGGLGDLRVLRVAFPKLVNRKPIYKSAYINTGGQKFKLEKVQDIKGIAYKTMQQKMMQELGTSLLRLALKKAAEQRARQANEGLGLAMAVLNAATEKADTRNWQTLPNQLFYTRVPLSEGKQSIQLNCVENKKYERNFNFDIEGKAGRTSFYNFHSLDSKPIEETYYYY